MMKTMKLVLAFVLGMVATTSMLQLVEAETDTRNSTNSTTNCIIPDHLGFGPDYVPESREYCLPEYCANSYGGPRTGLYDLLERGPECS